MIPQWLMDGWAHHQGLCLMLASALVMGAAWLWTAWDCGRRGRCRAPVRWYTGYVPPEFALPANWDLRDLREEYSAETGNPKENSPSTGRASPHQPP